MDQTSLIIGDLCRRKLRMFGGLFWSQKANSPTTVKLTGLPPTNKKKVKITVYLYSLAFKSQSTGGHCGTFH
jgi:hypothetical protein